MTALDVSMIVCTSDRPERLRALLESACALSIPAGLAWEVLVIDNPGSAENEAAVQSFAKRLPVRILREPRPGLCPARNRAVGEALGTYLCWTDDDTLLDPEWIAAYARAFRRHPEAALFGGRILPELEQPADPDFVRYLHQWPINYVVAHRDMGDSESPITLEGGRLPWGANLAARAEEQRSHPYDESLGLSPFHRRTGEETDLAYRILKAGGSGWWVPDSKVRHCIPPKRQTRAHIVDHYEQAGRTAAYLHACHPGDNSIDGFGPLPFARFGDVGLSSASAAARSISAAADLIGLTGPALRFLARSAYYRGILAHRAEQVGAAASMAPLGSEIEGRC